MKYKECACCHRLLDVSFFSKNKKNKDGLHSYCRECNKRKAQEFNRKKGNEYTKKYRMKLVDKGYYRFGHGAYENMKKSAKKRGILFTLTENELKNWWMSTSDTCFYCGITIYEYLELRDFIINYSGTNEEVLNIRKTVFNKEIYTRIKTMTIDRVDSGGPYSLDNIVKSCWICNSLKSNKISQDEMMSLGKKTIKLLRREMKNESRNIR